MLAEHNKVSKSYSIYLIQYHQNYINNKKIKITNKIKHILES